MYYGVALVHTSTMASSRQRGYAYSGQRPTKAPVRGRSGMRSSPAPDLISRSPSTISETSSPGGDMHVSLLLRDSSPSSLFHIQVLRTTNFLARVMSLIHRRTTASPAARTQQGATPIDYRRITPSHTQSFPFFLPTPNTRISDNPKSCPQILANLARSEDQT